MAEEKLSMEDVVRHVEETTGQGRIVNGKIIDIDEERETVLVDTGQKAEGVLNLSEFEDEEIKVGDEVEVYIIKQSPDYEHPPVLSHKKAKFEKKFEEMEQAYKEKLVLDAVLERKIKGGMIADISGVKAFMPASLIGYPMVKDLDSVVGKTVPCRIIDFDRRKKNIVVSWKKAIEEDVRRKREELFEQLYPGKTVTGRVSGIKSFGAFVDIGGIDGLLHISELSWGHVNKVENVLEVGEEIEVKVKNFNPSSNRISLSLKDTMPHPWENIEDKYSDGDIVKGKITGVTSYGAFVEIEPGVEGLVRTEEISWTENIKHPQAVLSNGDTIEVKILNVDRENEKMALSIRKTRPNPWEEVAEKYQAGNTLEGEVSHITDFGAFVMVEKGVEGLIHISDITWEKEIKHPGEVLEVGQKVKAKVLGIDADKQKVSLGLKQLEENPYNDYPKGSNVEATVTEVQKGGAYLKLENGLEAYLHISNYDPERTDDLREHLDEGDTVKARVVKNNPEKKYIEVSRKDMLRSKEKKNMEKYMDSSSGRGATLKDLIGDKLKGLTEKDENK
ncbi:MAG: 30S ribosomal protein S1 [Elusimicrobiota bacterium]